MRSSGVVVRGVDPKHSLQVAAAHHQDPVQHSLSTARTLKGAVGCVHSVHIHEQGNWTWRGSRARPAGVYPDRKHIEPGPSKLSGKALRLGPETPQSEQAGSATRHPRRGIPLPPKNVGRPPRKT
jgi:hypothetical protein